MAQQNTLSFAARPAEDRFEDLMPDELTESEADSVIDLALAVLRDRHKVGKTVMDNPMRTRQYIQLALAEKEREVFGVLFMDNRNRVLAMEELFQGTVDGASVYPRIVLQRALALNACAVVFYHNHPSGNPEPSRADQVITGRLRDALKYIDVRVLDHIVVGTEGSLSFAEQGLI